MGQYIATNAIPKNADHFGHPKKHYVKFCNFLRRSLKGIVWGVF